MTRTRTALFAAALALPMCSFAAPSEDVAAMIPAEMNAAAFINVGKIFDEYGMLFDGGPLAQQIEQFVAMGMPDPRKEGIRQVGIAGDIESFDDDSFTFAATRSADAPASIAQRFADFAAATGQAKVEEEAHRGVTFYKIGEPDSEIFEAKIADVAGNGLIASISKSGDHAAADQMVDTAAGQMQSFAQKHGTQLDAHEYATVSFEVPEKFRKEIQQTQFNFLSLVQHARASLGAKDGEVRLALDGVCADDFDAEALKRALEKVFEELRKQVPGGDAEWSFILDSVQFSRNDNVATVSLAMPEDLVNDLLGAFTGNEAAVD